MLSDANIKDALKATGNDKLKASDKSRDGIRTNMILAEKLGVNGTPATLVGDEMIPGAIDAQQFEAVVRSSLSSIISLCCECCWLRLLTLVTYLCMLLGLSFTRRLASTRII